MNTLGPNEVRVVITHLDQTSAAALRCVCRWLSEVPRLSEKRYWFAECVYCGIRLKNQRPDDVSSVFGKIYLMRNINLECGCRCHRNCYAIATNAHVCTNHRHKTMIPGRYLPSPLVPVIKRHPEYIGKFDKWLIYMRHYCTNLRVNIAADAILKILARSGIHSERGDVRRWLKNSGHVDQIVMGLRTDYKQLTEELMN